MEHGSLLVRGLKRKGKTLIIESPFPLMGHIGFGVIDRGYNNLQVRITSNCALSCIFCSVNAGPHSPRVMEFQVNDPAWLAQWVSKAVGYKGPLHVLFDGAGDPLAHPRFVEHVRTVSQVPGVLSVAVETRLHGADYRTIDRLAEAGVVRLNVSIDTLNPEKARYLAGSPFYNIEDVKKLAIYAFREHGIEVHITPVWIPGVNDSDIEDIIKWIKENPLTNKYPPLGIQKYVVHKRGRKIPGIREWSWERFFEKLRELERVHGIKLVLSPEDFGLYKADRIPLPYKRGDIVKLTIVSEGWLNGEYLAVPIRMDRVFTVLSKDVLLNPGDVVKARVIRDIDGIYLARIL